MSPLSSSATLGDAEGQLLSCDADEESTIELAALSSIGGQRRSFGRRAAVGISSAFGLAVAAFAYGRHSAVQMDAALTLSHKVLDVPGAHNLTCAKDYSTDCRNMPCCNEFTSCFERDEELAACKPTCALGAPDEAPPWDPDATKLPWSCKVLGSEGKAPKWEPAADAPLLYCFLLALVMGNEPELLRRQLSVGSSIFGCNAYSIFSERKMFIGEGPSGQVVSTPIGGPMTSTATNTEEFVRAWAKVGELGIYKEHDWTVKVDPDTMFIPSKLRPKLAAHSIATSIDRIYWKNCEVYTSVQGPLEIFSAAAAEAFFTGLEMCRAQDYIMGHGEDWFFGHCMDFLGVRFDKDYELLDDNYCGDRKGDLPCGSGMAAYHPLKTVEGYMACFEGSK